MPTQYRVVIVNLNPTVGSEVSKTRPCIVVSPDEMNQFLDTVVIVPLTSTYKDLPSRVKIERKGKGESYACLDQIRTISKLRIHQEAEMINEESILAIKDTFHEMFVL